MKKLLFLAVACIGIGFHAVAMDKVTVIYDNTKDVMYREDGNIYAEPHWLENGKRWKVVKKDKKMYAEVEPVGIKDKQMVEIPYRLWEGKPYINFTFFAPQAGLDYDYNDKKKEIILKEKSGDTQIKKQGPVIFMWDPDRAFSADKNFFTKKMGRRILSPTWGSYKDIHQIPLSIVYLQRAKAAGIEVMPLLHNDFEIEETKKLITNPKAGVSLSSAMAATALVYGLDGWNLDFENMDPKDKNWYTEFVEGVAKPLHAMNKTISVDITVYNPYSLTWSLCYDRQALSDVVDYEIIMGYDQTAGGSSYSGSVSSYAWLDKNIEKLVTMVPKEKLVLGLPLYTRVWRGKEGQAKSSVLTTKYMSEFLSKHELITFWENKDRQYIGVFKNQAMPGKVWFEEKRSLTEKMKLAKKYELAGLAFWRYGFQEEELFPELERRWIGEYRLPVKRGEEKDDILVKIKEKLKTLHVPKE